MARKRDIQKINLPFAGSANTLNDHKVLGTQEFESLKNCRLTEKGELDKHPGFTALPTLDQAGNAVDTPVQLYGGENCLQMRTLNRLYTLNENEDRWYDDGKLTSPYIEKIEVTDSALLKTLNGSYRSSGSGSVPVYALAVISKLDSGNWGLYFQMFDSDTRKALSNSIFVEDIGSAPVYAHSVQGLQLSAAFGFYYINFSTNQLKFLKIEHSSPDWSVPTYTTPVVGATRTSEHYFSLDQVGTVINVAYTDVTGITFAQMSYSTGSASATNTIAGVSFRNPIVKIGHEVAGVKQTLLVYFDAPSTCHVRRYPASGGLGAPTVVGSFSGTDDTAIGHLTSDDSWRGFNGATSVKLFAVDTFDVLTTDSTKPNSEASLAIASKAFSVGDSVFVHLYDPEDFEVNAGVGNRRNLIVVDHEMDFIGTAGAYSNVGGWESLLNPTTDVFAETVNSFPRFRCVFPEIITASFNAGLTTIVRAKPLLLEYNFEKPTGFADTGIGRYFTGWGIKQGTVNLGFVGRCGLNNVADVVTGTGIFNPPDVVTYRALFRYRHKNGLVDYSGSVDFTHTVAGIGSKITVQVKCVAHRDFDNVEVLIYRTTINPSGDPVFYLVQDEVTSLYAHRQATAGGLVTITDNFPDASLILSEQFPRSNAELDPGPAPACNHLEYAKGRLIGYGGGAFNQQRLIYSKLVLPGDAPSFNEDLVIDVDGDSGTLQILEEQSNALVVWKENSIWVISGEGPDNLGQGDFTPANRLNTGDIGAKSHLFTRISQGLVFQGPENHPYVFNSGFGVKPLAQLQLDFDREFTGMTRVFQDETEYLYLQSAFSSPDSSATACLDIKRGFWTIQSELSGKNIVNYGDQFAFIDASDNSMVQHTNYQANGQAILREFYTPWFKVRSFHEVVRFYSVFVDATLHATESLVSDSDFRVDVYYDGREDSIYNFTWDTTATVHEVGSYTVLLSRLHHFLRRQRATAIRLKFTEISVVAGKGPILHSMTLNFTPQIVPGGVANELRVR